MTATTARMTTAEKVAQRNRTDVIRIARQHAEAALCHYAHVNGFTFTDEQFDAELALLTDKIRGGLVAMHARRVAPAGREGAYETAPRLRGGL